MPPSITYRTLQGSLTTTRLTIGPNGLYTNHMAIKLNHKIPVLAYDNLTLKTKADGSFQLIFSQYVTEGTDNEEADVVAAVQVVNEAKWIEMRDYIDSALKELKKREL